MKFGVENFEQSSVKRKSVRLWYVNSCCATQAHLHVKISVSPIASVSLLQYYFYAYLIYSGELPDYAK